MAWTGATRTTEAVYASHSRRLRSAVVATKRMSKDEFYKALSGLDEAALKKVLWVLYWRGTNQVRERIEVEIQPADAPAPARGEAVDPQVVLGEITDFVSLARDGAYMAGNRRVSPRNAAGGGSPSSVSPKTPDARSPSTSLPAPPPLNGSSTWHARPRATTCFGRRSPSRGAVLRRRGRGRQRSPGMQTGAADRARALMRECLTELPHQDFLTFAKEIGAR